VQDNTKTNSSDRIIDLNVNAQNAIIRLLEANPIGEFLIQNPNGNIVAPSNLTKAFYGVLDNIGFKRVGIHSLRHTYASLLFERGADPKTVSVLLGHSSIKTTYDIYIHVLSERQAKTVKLLDDI
jgi:integrase